MVLNNSSLLSRSSSASSAFILLTIMFWFWDLKASLAAFLLSCFLKQDGLLFLYLEFSWCCRWTLLTFTLNPTHALPACVSRSKWAVNPLLLSWWNLEKKVSNSDLDILLADIWIMMYAMNIEQWIDNHMLPIRILCIFMTF